MTTFSLFTMTNMSHDINGQFSLLTQFSILHDAHLNDKGGYSKQKKEENKYVTDSFQRNKKIIY